MDRLLTYKGEADIIINQSYNENGTISTNNTGAYAYTIANKPFQESTITPPSPSPALNYYSGCEQNVTYNVFDNPLTVTEESQENIDFGYNPFNNRSTMCYGGLQADKNLRPFRKFYSVDGLIDIKSKTSSPTSTEFIFFIGGDGYSAPIILKSDGTTQNYFYLHRDHQ